MYTLEGSGIILGACGKEWIQKFKKDMVAAGLTDEEIKFQLRDPQFARASTLCVGTPKQKFVELWNSSVQKMRKAGLDYRKMDCEMELRGNEVYCTEHYGDRLPYEYLCLGEDYDPFDENY